MDAEGDTFAAALDELRALANQLDELARGLVEERAQRAAADHRFAELRGDVDEEVQRLRDDVAATVAHLQGMVDGRLQAMAELAVRVERLEQLLTPSPPA